MKSIASYVSSVFFCLRFLLSVFTHTRIHTQVYLFIAFYLLLIILIGVLAMFSGYHFKALSSSTDGIISLFLKFSSGF